MYRIMVMSALGVTRCKANTPGAATDRELRQIAQQQPYRGLPEAASLREAYQETRTGRTLA